MTSTAAAPSASPSGLARDWAGAGRDVVILCGSEEGGLRDTVDQSVKVMAVEPPVRRGFLLAAGVWRGRWARVPKALQPDLIFLPGNFHALLANGLRSADPQRKDRAQDFQSAGAGNMPFGGAVFPAHHPGSRRLCGDEFRVWRANCRRCCRGATSRPCMIRSISSPRRASRARDGERILWIGRLEPQKDPRPGAACHRGDASIGAADHAGRGPLAGCDRQRRSRPWGCEERVTRLAMSRPSSLIWRRPTHC